MFPLFRAPLSYVILALPIIAIVLLGFESHLLRQWSNAHLKIDFLVNFLFLNAFHIIAGLTLLTLPTFRDWYFAGRDADCGM